jgi:uncharacterized protein (UPF0297 family)
MKNMTNTQFFQVESGPQISAKDILEIVYKALSEKGYNPVNQIVGYIMSGDPTYITSHNNARSLIMKVERDEILEELMRNYVETCIERKGREKK